MPAVSAVHPLAVECFDRLQIVARVLILYEPIAPAYAYITYIYIIYTLYIYIYNMYEPIAPAYTYTYIYYVGTHSPCEYSI